MESIENIQDILFLDIETVPIVDHYSNLSKELQYHWSKKSLRLYRDKDPEEVFFEKAGIYSEFGKIICISCAFVYENHAGDLSIRTKSFYGDDEEKIIVGFLNLVDKYFYQSKHRLCGHNLKEFDIPYILRRALVHQIRIPAKLRISGKKPWEVNFLIDTLELWKFGDYKSYISLDLLHLIVLGEPAKSGIDGSQVGQYYYNENKVDEIVQYCERDVKATIKVFLSLYSRLTDDKLDFTGLS